MRAALRHLAARLAAAASLLLVVMVTLGVLLTDTLTGQWPLTEEDELSAALAEGRTPVWDAVTLGLSLVSSTGAIVALMLAVAVGWRVRYRRWRESAFLVAAVSTQAVVFLATTLVIDRRRPEVDHLDVAPPTSSFPSGHTGAALALCLSVAVVLAWRTRRRWLRPVVVAALLLVPVAVAFSRLYRGMHHPTDVVGSLVNGTGSTLVAARLLLLASLPPALAAVLDRHRPARLRLARPRRPRVSA